MWDELASQIEFECGQLQKLFDLFRPVVDRCAQGVPGRFEVAALGAMLHSFYGGVENVFKRISLEVDGGRVLSARVSNAEPIHFGRFTVSCAFAADAVPPMETVRGTSPSACASGTLTLI